MSPMLTDVHINDAAAAAAAVGNDHLMHHDYHYHDYHHQHHHQLKIILPKMTTTNEGSVSCRLDEVFMTSALIKAEVSVISRSRRLRLITLTDRDLDYFGYHKNRI